MISYQIGARRTDILKWVLEQMEFPCLIGEDFWAIGVYEDKDLIGGIIFHDLRILNHGYECELTIAGHSCENWLTRKAIKYGLALAFVHLDCVRVVAGCHPDNEKSRRIIEKFGFVQEGRLRERFGPGQDVLIYSLLRRECKWLNALANKDGKIS